MSLVFAIADHPRVGSANGAAARIAMTVGERVAKDDARESGAVERGSDPNTVRLGRFSGFTRASVDVDSQKRRTPENLAESSTWYPKRTVLGPDPMDSPTA